MPWRPWVPPEPSEGGPTIPDLAAAGAGVSGSLERTVGYQHVHCFYLISSSLSLHCLINELNYNRVLRFPLTTALSFSHDASHESHLTPPPTPLKEALQ